MGLKEKGGADGDKGDEAATPASGGGAAHDDDDHAAADTAHRSKDGDEVSHAMPLFP